MNEYKNFLSRIIPHLLTSMKETQKIIIERHGNQFMIMSDVEPKENYPSAELTLGDKVMLRSNDPVLSNAVLGRVYCMTEGPYVEDPAYLIVAGNAILGWYSAEELVKL